MRFVWFLLYFSNAQRINGFIAIIIIIIFELSSLFRWCFTSYSMQQKKESQIMEIVEKDFIFYLVDFEINATLKLKIKVKNEREK